MKTTVAYPTDTTATLTITIGAEELAAAEQVALKKLSATMKVAGFRKGKVPVSVAAKHADPQALQQEILDSAIIRAAAEAVVVEQIKALDRPSVAIQKYVPGDLLEFTAEFDVMPKIKLGNYKKLKADEPKVTVVKKDIDEAIERMRTGLAEKVDVKRAAEDGDETVIDFIGKKGDIAFDGGTGNDYTLKLGSHQFIPGFEEGIVGHKAGETFDLELTFPDDYHAKELAGQAVVFTTTLKSVKEIKLPELDDAFAVKAGFKTIDELKANVKTELTTQRQTETDNAYKDTLIDALVAASDIPLPQILVDDQMKSIEQDFIQNLSYRGVDLATYLSSNGFADEANWREKEVRSAAERRTKAGLVLAEVSQAENITVDDEAVDAQIAKFLEQYSNSPQAIEQFKQPAVRQDITNRMVTDKTIDRLVELNRSK